MKFLWRNCKYLFIFIIVLLLLSFVVYTFTPIPTQVWCIIAIFIGYGAAKLDNKGG